MAERDDEPFEDSLFEFPPEDDEQDAAVPNDWRNRPPKSPPRRPKYLGILDEMYSRPGTSDQEEPSRTSNSGNQDRDNISMLPPAALRGGRRIPREVTYEIMRAPPALVSAYKDARNAYVDAIYAWWLASGPRERWDVPTELDYELVKLDPRVRAAERSLAAVDARLSAEGHSVRVATVRNDGSARRAMLDDIDGLEKAWQAAQAAKAAQANVDAVAGRKRPKKTAPTPDPVQFVLPEPPAAQEAPTPASTVSAATARTSPSGEALTDYSATSPEPEDDPEDEGYKPNWRFKETKRRRTAGS